MELERWEEFLALPEAAGLFDNFSEMKRKRAVWQKVVLQFSHCLNILKNVGEKDDTETDHPDVDDLNRLMNFELDDPGPVQRHLLRCAYCRLYTIFGTYLEISQRNAEEVDQECADRVARVLRQAAENKLRSVTFGARTEARA